MIEMELENADKSVILKCSTFNAQRAVGNLTAAGANVQSLDSNNSQSSAQQAVSDDEKILRIKQFASVQAKA